MNFHFPFFAKLEPAPLSDLPMRSHGRFTTSPKEKQRQARYVSIRGELAVYKATTTPAQRKAEADAFFAEAKAREAIRRAARGRGA